MADQGEITFVDLDEARAARAELNPAKGIILGGEEFLLRPEVPAEMLELLTVGRILDALATLLLDPDGDRERLRATMPTERDIEAILALYGTRLGESSASVRPSASTGAPSKPTSGGSTASTSAGRSGASRRS